MKNSEDNVNVVTEVKGKGKGREEGGSKTRPQYVLDAREEGATSSADYHLANRLVKDSTGGNSGLVPADETSERVARYQKRRTLKDFSPLCKARDTKSIAVGGKGMDGRSEAGVSLAAGPKPGMTRAEPLEAVKGLGLKPRGARKVDLEACWYEAVKSRTDEKSSKGDEGGEFEDKIVGGADTDGNVREIDEGNNVSNHVDEEELDTEDMKDYAEDDDDAGEQSGPKATSELNMGMEGEGERETAGRDNTCAEAGEDEDPNDDTGGMEDGDDLGDYFEEGYVEQNDMWAGEGREAQDGEGEDKEQDIDGDEDEDEDDNEMALEEHVGKVEAKSWEDGGGGNDERVLDYGDEDNNKEELDNDDGGDDGVASDYGYEGASEWEDEEGEEEGERMGIAAGMAMAMTGDTEEAAIDLAESDVEVTMPTFCITQADNCAPINDEYHHPEGSSSDDREAGSMEDGEAPVSSDVDSPATVAAVDSDANASAEFVQRVKTCVENIEGAVKDDAYADDMNEEDSDEIFEAREALEERRLASATCSASEWDDKVVLALNPFLEQGRQLLGRRYVSNCYAGRASDPGWHSGHATVPAMRSRDLSPTVASRPTRPDASGEGVAYVAYSAFSTPTRHQAETRQASDEPTSSKDKEPMVSEQYQRYLFDEQFGRARLTCPSLPGFASNASPFSSASRVPSYSMGPKGSIAPSQAVTPGIDRKPAFSSRRSVGSGIVGRPARTLQANSPSVLRYRLRDLSSRRRSRSSLCPSLGPAHEGLGSKPGAGDSGRVAKDDLVQNEMRQRVQQPSTNNSTVHIHGTAAMENSRKRYQAFMSESEGAGTMKSRRITMDGAKERALRVAAAARARTEVGNIILSVVSGREGGGDAIDLRRQEREEAEARAQLVGERETLLRRRLAHSYSQHRRQAV